MHAERLEDAAEFLTEAGPLLLADEARHNLILGIAGTIRDSPDVYPLRSLWVVRKEGRPVAAAIRTPPYNLILARPESPVALEALADGIAEELPGVNGCVPEAEEFAELWAERSGARPRTNMRQGIYALQQVRPLPAVPGSARVATLDDRDLVLRWWIAFGDEVLHEGGPGRENAEAMVGHRLAARGRGFLLWEDAGDVVSIAGWGVREATMSLAFGFAGLAANEGVNVSLLFGAVYFIVGAIGGLVWILSAEKAAQGSAQLGVPE